MTKCRQRAAKSAPKAGIPAFLFLDVVVFPIVSGLHPYPDLAPYMPLEPFFTIGQTPSANREIDKKILDVHLGHQLELDAMESKLSTCQQ